MSACPTGVTLQRLDSGNMGDATFRRVEAHVEGCAKCQRLLELFVRNGVQGSVRSITPDCEELAGLSEYEFERELGRGGHGAVFLAKERRLDRYVALKIVPRHSPNRTDGSAPCLTEGQAVCRSRHPNIVQIHREFEVCEWTILVMEYVPGGTLAEQLSDPMSQDEAARILRTLSRTIAHLHDESLLHLDIKPSNVLVNCEPGDALDPERVKISDFGISISCNGQPSNVGGISGWGGTPTYMAPEQAGVVDAPVGPAADVYALGALLYHLITGRPPFQSPAICTMLELIATADPIPPRQLNPRIPTDLELICLHCLQKPPERRYPSAHALADDLRRFLDGRCISLRSLASFERTVRWCRRQPAITALLAALAFTIVGSIMALLYMLHVSDAARVEAITARQTAEENEVMASRTLEEFESWLLLLLSNPDLLMDYHLPASRTDLRELTENLRGVGGSTIRMTATTGELQRDLAAKIASQGEKTGGPSEAAAILTRSRAHLSDSLRRNPDSDLLRNELVLNLIDAGALARQLREYEKTETYFRSAETLAMSITQNDLRRRALICLSMNRNWIGLGCRIVDQEEAGHRALNANLAMIEGLQSADSDLPDLQLQKARTLAALDRSAEAMMILQKLSLLTPTAWLRLDYAELSFRIHLGLPVIESLVWDRTGNSETGAIERGRQALELVESIRRRASEIGINQPDIPAIAVVLSKFVQIGYASQRKRNAVETQSDSVERFLAFAKEVVRMDSDRWESHLFLSDAYEQVAKNAQHFDCKPRMLDAYRHAVTAIMHANKLNPDSVEIRQLLSNRNAKLKQVEEDSVSSTNP